MSITKAREIIEKPGCGITVGVVLVLAFILSMVFNRAPSASQREHDEEGATLATVGSTRITDGQFRQATNNLLEQRSMFGSGASLVAQTKAEVISGLVEQALRVQLLMDKGANVSDEQIMKAAEGEIDSEFERQRIQLMMQGQVKPEDLDKEFEKRLGMPVAEAKKRSLENLRQALKDSGKRAQIVRELATALLTQIEENSIQVNDEDVRKAQSTYVLKPIQITGAGAKSKAEAALKEIKGGLAFDQAMDRYSKYPVEKGKAEHEARQRLQLASIQANPAMKALENLKPGELSEVIGSDENATIYQLEKVEPLAAAEYDKNKAGYRQSYVQTLASARLAQQVDELKSKVQWQSEGHKLLFEVWNASVDAKLDSQSKLAKLKELAKASYAAMNSGTGGDAAADAAFLAISSIWQQGKDADRKELAAERKAVWQQMIEREGDIALALDLATTMIEEKSPEAATMLLNAAQMNQQFEAANQSYYNEILAKLNEAKTAKLVTEEQEREIQVELERWRKGKAEEERMKAEAAKAQEELEKKDKAAQEEARKREGEEKKKNAPPSSPSAPPAPATTGR